MGNLSLFIYCVCTGRKVEGFENTGCHPTSCWWSLWQVAQLWKNMLLLKSLCMEKDLPKFWYKVGGTVQKNGTSLLCVRCQMPRMWPLVLMVWPTSYLPFQDGRILWERRFTLGPTHEHHLWINFAFEPRSPFVAQVDFQFIILLPHPP